jgi:hypothetical protein
VRIGEEAKRSQRNRNKKKWILGVCGVHYIQLEWRGTGTSHREFFEIMITEKHEMKTLSKYTATDKENSRKEQQIGAATKNEMIHEMRS